MPHQPPVVLVVEDDDDHRELFVTQLTLAGYPIVAAASAEEALERIHNVSIDVAVVDLRLPGMAGAQLISVLRQTRPSCRVVVTSVLDHQDYPIADARLPKPFDRMQLLSAIGAGGSIPAQRTPSDVLAGDRTTSAA